MTRVSLIEEEGYPLSPQQERLWALQQQGIHTAYTIQGTIQLQGNVLADRVLQSLEILIQNYEILRTSLQHKEQVIAAQGDVCWLYCDLSAVEEPSCQIEALSTQQSLYPFQLRPGPLLHAIFIKHTADSALLMICLPAFCADTYTLTIFTRLLSETYEHLSVGQPTVEYRQIAAWLTALQNAEELEEGRAFWRRQIAPQYPLAPHLLFKDLASRALPFEEGILYAPLATSLAEQIVQQATALATTRENYMLTCWLALLRRFMDQPTICSGLACHGRTEEELLAVPGPLTRYVPLSLAIDEKRTFYELLKSVDELAQHDRAWQECFSWDLMTQQEPENNFFAVCFEYQEQLPPSTEGPARFQLVRSRAHDERYWIKGYCLQGDEEASIQIHFDKAAFSERSMLQLLHCWHMMLESIVAHPHLQIDAYPLLSIDAYQRIISPFNDTAVDFPQDRCVHHLWQDQCRQSPDRVAIIAADQHLSYGELEQRANQLAHYLRHHGVGIETIVALYVHRSLEMVVGLLGILKAGAAYVPLDPGYPQKRLAMMLEDSSPAVLLTQQALVSELPTYDALVCCLDRDWHEIENEATEDLGVVLDGENLAYVIFTSGSSGRPKGSMITHRALCNHMHWMQRSLLLLNETDRVLQKAPFSFDGSVWEFYAPLLNGACLVMADPHHLQDPFYLIDEVQRQQISTLQSVPSLLRVLLEEPKFARCTSLKRIVCGGEVLDKALTEQVLALMDVEIFNIYGPTEATMNASWWKVRREDRRALVPIGTPLDNTQISILDAALQPLPACLPGELYIGGIAVGRGYLKRPDRTAEAFLPDPFSTTPGGRLYKTGDLARYLPDGTLEYLGRIDQQVKIRGFRVELAEIESALAAHAAVQHAVVVARQNVLIAYIVGREAAFFKPSELRSFLLQSLPEYMIPSLFIQLAQLPLLPNGKVDRQRLPDPKPSEAVEDIEEPMTVTEGIIAHLWKQLLELQQIDRNSSFFDLGGHSLLVIPLILRVRQIFHVEISIRDLLEHATLARFARFIDAAQPVAEEEAIPPIPRDMLFPLSFEQQRLWFLQQLAPADTSYTIRAVIKIMGPLHTDILHRSLNELVKRHEAFRTVFALQDGQAVQRIVPVFQLALPLIDLSDFTADECQRLAHIMARAEARQGFDLSQGPLLRVKLLRCQTDSYFLLLTMHHMISDGWSTSVMTRELAALYSALREGKEISLPPLKVQYADFAVWQQRRLRDSYLERLQVYWKQQLTGAPFLTLPTDRERPEHYASEGAEISHTLAPEVYAWVKTMNQATETTPFMLLLAIFFVVLFCATEQDDLVVGTDYAGRDRIELEPLIGFFINVLPLRVRLDGDPTFIEVLRTVRETALGAYAHHALPFSQIVRLLNRKRDIHFIPLCQVLFVYQNVPDMQLNFADIRLELQKIQEDTARFELAVFLAESVEGLLMTWNYRSDLFESTTIEQMIADFDVLLHSLMKAPDRRLHQLKALVATERKRSVVKEKSPHAHTFERFKSQQVPRLKG